ncbi:474_t:CDS:2, partial [Funneliformis caledonium]
MTGRIKISRTKNANSEITSAINIQTIKRDNLSQQGTLRSTASQTGAPSIKILNSIQINQNPILVTMVNKMTSDILKSSKSTQVHQLSVNITNRAISQSIVKTLANRKVKEDISDVTEM